MTKDYWRYLDDGPQEPAAADVTGEFAKGASVWPPSASRRGFLQLMSASLALAGLQGCRRPEEKILPYVEMPEHIVPGKPLYFATARPWDGHAIGLVVETHEGRPTKIEGNELHPGSRGRVDALSLASILSLYDPDRSRAVLNRRQISSRVAFLRNLRLRLDSLAAAGGKGLWILTEKMSSPTFIHQLEALRERYPDFHWQQFEPVPADALLAGTQLAFGEPLQPVLDFTRADVILSLDADFLDTVSWPLTYAYDYIAQRRLVGEGWTTPEMNRLYVIETSPTLTGSKADHCWRVSPQDMHAVVHSIARACGIDAGAERKLPPSIPPEWIDAVVADLRSYRRRSRPGTGLVVPGRSLPVELQALVHAINDRLDNAGTTVQYIRPSVPYAGDQVESLRELVEAMQAGDVEMLMILGANPVFTSPADIPFAEAMNRVPFSAHLGLYEDETAALCDWHLPGLHFLESWSDVRAFEGTASLIQPLIAPLYDGWSEHTLVALLAGASDTSPYELVREYWRGRLSGDFESQWEESLRRGTVPDSAASPVSVSLQLDALLERSESDGEKVQTAGDRAPYSLTALFRPDPCIWDGRYANNGWLQELPKPLTKLTWDNAALLAPRTSERLGVRSGQVLQIQHGEREIGLPVWIAPGHPEDCVTLYFGYGRERAGHVGHGTGWNVYPLRTSRQFWSAPVDVRPTDTHVVLASTQQHQSMEDRHPVEHGTLDQLQPDGQPPPFLHSSMHLPIARSLLPEWQYDSYKWGMSIDLTACVGCNACTLACQAENNIPVVGKDQVAMGREMHWIRVDTYFHGEADHPQTFHQPVPCMHCEKAPCELVCPVSATTHSDEGLNEMTYNRCVGTRYCSNNCPYKVRRFNFLQYADYDTPVLALLNNPNVTVRSRGVMEKCTYCVQRINAVRIEADKGQRRIGPNEVVTACQAACPTQAIMFGDLNNPQSRLVQWKQSPLDYALLEDANTQPRTTYLAEVRNPRAGLELPRK